MMYIIGPKYGNLKVLEWAKTTFETFCKINLMNLFDIVAFQRSAS